MKRLPHFLVFPIVTIGIWAAVAHGQGGPDSDNAIKNALYLQQAMAQARHHLLEAQPKKAVAVLEEQLPKVGGNASYIALLRESYRAYITHLWHANQPELARRYVERLCVIDPGAATDAALRPPVDKEKRGIERPPVVEASAPVKPAYPKYVKAAEPTKSGGTKKADTVKADPVKAIDVGPKPSTVRAHGETLEASLDPFDPEMRRPDPERDSKTKLAQMLLSRAEEQFAKRKFAEAKSLYEEALQADRAVVTPSKERYAYCLLDQVVTELNSPGLNLENLPALQKQVAGAVTMAPGLNETGKWLLREIELRVKDKLVAASPEIAVDVKHLGRNKEGWTVAETAHFRIFHHQQADFAEKVAQIAERTRATMFRKWFGHDGVEWTPKCELIIHDTGDSYHKMTGVPASSPGHSRIESDPSGKRVVARRMDLRADHPGFLEAVLPHETTHVVLAGMFGGHAVPRWADEGIAVLSEPADKIEHHRRNLTQSASLGQMFALKELMELNDYPQARRIGAFYAQSVAFVDFLTRQKGPIVMTRFLGDGLRDGYESALRRHYSLDFAGLEQRWQEHLSTQAVAAR